MSWMLVFGFFSLVFNVGSYFGSNDCRWNCFDLLGSLRELGPFVFVTGLLAQPMLYGLRSEVISWIVWQMSLSEIYFCGKGTGRLFQILGFS